MHTQMPINTIGKKQEWKPEKSTNIHERDFFRFMGKTNRSTFEAKGGFENLLFYKSSPEVMLNFKLSTFNQFLRLNKSD